MEKTKGLKLRVKILFVCQYFYPENFKGNDIVFDLVKKGYQITVLTAKPNYPHGKFYKGYSFFGKRKENINGVKVIRVPVYPRRNGKGIHLILNYVSFVFFSYFAILFRIKEKFDSVFIQQLSPVTMAFPGFWIKKKQNIPVFLWVLDLWPESVIATTKLKKGYVIKFLDHIVRSFYNKSDVILISSNYFKKSILEKCDDKNKKVVYFPNWAEDIFEKKAFKKYKLPPFPSGFNVMFAGNIGESHGFETILKAAKRTADFGINWIVVGAGRKYEWIKNQIFERKLSNVYLMGRHPLETMPLFFKKADAMLISLKNDPIFSLTVPAKFQAYIASGKIVLGAINGECSDLIKQSGVGICVPAMADKELANASIKLSKSTTKEREKMSRNAKAFYKKYFSKKMLLNQLEDLLLDYCKK